MTDGSAGEITRARRRRPHGAVRDGLVAAGLELARAGGPDAVVLREAARMVGVVPNAAYRHFADRDELLAAVSTVAMGELAARMAAGTGRVPGRYGDAAAARRRLRAIGRAYHWKFVKRPSPACADRAIRRPRPVAGRDHGTRAQQRIAHRSRGASPRPHRRTATAQCGGGRRNTE